MASKTFSGVKGRVMIGQGAPDWTASTDYGINDLVQPTTKNDMVYRCKTAGTSDSSEPTWSTVEGTEITDGTVTWVAMPYIVAKMNQQDLNLQGSEIDTSGFEDTWGTSDTTDNKWSGSETPPRAWGRQSLSVPAMQATETPPRAWGRRNRPRIYDRLDRNTPTGVGKT